MFATQLHREQCRKGSNVPYVSHLLAVSSLVIEHDGDEDQAIAALLHDAIEDQGGPKARARILRRFGERVTRIVDGCTDSQADPKPPWRARKEAFIAGISEKSPSVQLVCAADKLHNARCILSDYRKVDVGEKVWRRFEGRREGTLWYYRELANALVQSGRTPLVDELERVVGEIERLVDKQRR